MSSSLTPVKWTRFWDMHSGGGLKEGNYSLILIEAPENEAVLVFYNRFGHSPYRVSCTCCGDDYSIEEYDSLAEATRYHRNADENEERDRSTDSIVLRLIAENIKRMDERMVALYNMAKDKSSPNEAKIAMDKIAATDMYPLWHSNPLITMAEFEATGRLKEGQKALIIRAGEIQPTEREGHLPRQGWVWED